MEAISQNKPAKEETKANETKKRTTIKIRTAKTVE